MLTSPLGDDDINNANRESAKSNVGTNPMEQVFAINVSF